MSHLTFYKDYKNNDDLRASFNELANLVFGIHFEEWYKNGCWNERYIPFSYIEGDKVVANVSVNLLDFIIDGEKKKAIQIGTVMTHPDYRNQGLSAKLIKIVLKEYENQYDFMYLFANQSVLDFYPKFGFKRGSEVQFFTPYSGVENSLSLKKLDGTNKEDLELIKKIASERAQVSKRFGTLNTDGLFMFYCLYVFNDHIYYDEEQESIVLFAKEGEQVDIFDIVSRTEINIDKIVTKIADKETTKIVYHYTPDYTEIDIQNELDVEDHVLFILENGNNQFPTQIKHPITSIA